MRQIPGSDLHRREAVKQRGRTSQPREASRFGLRIRRWVRTDQVDPQDSRTIKAVGQGGFPRAGAGAALQQLQHLVHHRLGDLFVGGGQGRQGRRHIGRHLQIALPHHGYVFGDAQPRLPQPATQPDGNVVGPADIGRKPVEGSSWPPDSLIEPDELQAGAPGSGGALCMARK